MYEISGDPKSIGVDSNIQAPRGSTALSDDPRLTVCYHEAINSFQLQQRLVDAPNTLPAQFRTDPIEPRAKSDLLLSTFAAGLIAFFLAAPSVIGSYRRVGNLLSERHGCLREVMANAKCGAVRLNKSLCLPYPGFDQAAQSCRYALRAAAHRSLKLFLDVRWRSRFKWLWTGP